MNSGSKNGFNWSLPLLVSVVVHVVVLWTAVAWFGPSDEPQEPETVEQTEKPYPVEEPEAANGGEPEPVRHDVPETRPPSRPGASVSVPPPPVPRASAAVSGASTSSPSTARTIVYEVKPGDNLTRIAKKHKCTVSEILKLNKIKPNKVLFVGLKLKIPAPVE